MTLDVRLLADRKDGGWSIAGGSYSFAIGENAEKLGAPVTVRLAAKSWKDRWRRGQGVWVRRCFFEAPATTQKATT